MGGERVSRGEQREPDLEKMAEAWVGHSDREGRLSRDFRFCPRCGAELPSDREMGFRCPSPQCGYRGARALVFSKNARFEIREGTLYHYSVGAALFCRFVEEEEDRVLLVRRATHPVGVFTIPSGHWDVTDENPLDAARREVGEETGLEPPPPWRLVSEPNELLEDACRRGSDYHYWHFYEARCHPEAADLKLATDHRRRVIGEWLLPGQDPRSRSAKRAAAVGSRRLRGVGCVKRTVMSGPGKYGAFHAPYAAIAHSAGTCP